MDLKKKTKTQIIKNIVESIAESPKSIYELSKELNSNWDTIKDNVQLLRELGILDVSERKVFLKKESIVSISDDSVAGLPLSKDIRKRIYALAKKIYDKWIELAKNEPNNTQLQKVLVEISEKFPSLNIPRGWYFYGEVVLVKVDKNKFSDDLDKYDFKKLSINMKELEKEISEVIKKISGMSTSELKRYQYEKFSKRDYIIKREAEELLLFKEFDIKKFSNLLYELVFDFEIVNDDPLNQKVLSIIKEAISVIITKAAGIDFKKDVSFRIQLTETFATFWKLYATYGLLITLKGDLGYDKRIIRSVFEDRINFYTKDLTEHFANFVVVN